MKNWKELATIFAFSALIIFTIGVLCAEFIVIWNWWGLIPSFGMLGVAVFLFPRFAEIVEYWFRKQEVKKKR